MRKKIMKLMSSITLLLVVFPLFLTAKAQGTSFDCEKATTKVEKLICADSELSRLDEEMSAVYKTTLQDEKHADSVRKAQKQWLKERNVCSDAACVKRAYETRLHGLSSLTTRHTPANNSAPVQQDAASQTKKPLYGHCVDVGMSGSCGEGQTGKGYTVCEDYLKYLNSLPDTPKCEVPVPPGFKHPEWEEVDFMQHLDWTYQIAKKKFYGPRRSLVFEDWKQLFLKDIAAGRIAPQMRKTQVRPLGGKPITLLAFTEDRLGCKRPYDKENPRYARWDGVGYLYYILTDDPVEPLNKVHGGFDSASSGTESVLLLYAGKPYFVRVYEPYASPFETKLRILAFDPSRWLTIPDRNMYSTMKLCDFSPVNQYKPKKSK